MVYLPYVEYVEQRIAERRRQETIREAEINRLLYEAGLIQPGPLSRLWSKLLGHLGHLLVAVGQRLECYSTSPVAWKTASRSHRISG